MARGADHYGGAWFVAAVVLSLFPPLKAHLHTKGPLHIPGHVLVFAISVLVACDSAPSLARRLVRCAAVVGFGCALEAMFGSGDVRRAEQCTTAT
jgi:hypothetical protein